jgi:hypothetical protein
MLPGARVARVVVLAVAIIVVLGLVLSTVTIPTSY